jgi:hypothetical protein
MTTHRSFRRSRTERLRKHCGKRSRSRFSVTSTYSCIRVKWTDDGSAQISSDPPISQPVGLWRS